jgi:hypothetical protein
MSLAEAKLHLRGLIEGSGTAQTVNTPSVHMMRPTKFVPIETSVSSAQG